MEKLNIKWLKRALFHFDMAMRWYQQNLGSQAAKSFSKGIERTVELLSQMPMMGTKERSISSKHYTYYHFLAHPKFRIVYRYTDTTLYVVAIRATMGSV